MMTSQGWEPGQFLGAKDAKHAEFHTAANASHIRVAIKDDNLGLGAKVGSGVGHGECTGLDVFKNILGRLNGKDEIEIQKEQQSREDLKRAIYTERKWGSIRFVQGGFLIGDKIQHLIDGEAERVKKLAEGQENGSSSSSSSSESESEKDAESVKEVKKSKKRKAEVLAEPVAKVVAVKVKKSKKSKKVDPTAEEEVVAILSDVKLSKKSKKDRKRLEEAELEETTEDSAAAQHKQEKRKRKREKEERKNEKAAKLEVEDGSKSSKKSKREKKKAEKDDGQSSEPSQPTTKESTPSVPLTAPSSGRSTPLMQGRHAVRSRNIAQKRLAAMDATALNQVCTLIKKFVCSH
jgi:Pin2-interacting protein X1